MGNVAILQQDKGCEHRTSQQQKCLQENIENPTFVDALSVNISKEDENKTAERLALCLNFL